MFEWDDANLRHIAQHEVSSEEAEQVIFNLPLDIEYENRAGEDRSRQVGETDQGRILVVVSTWRGDNIRVITAYPPSRALKTFYLTQKGANYG